VSPAPLTGRQLRYAIRPGTWRHLGRRARWSLTPRRAPGRPLTWPLPADPQAPIRVRWPGAYGWPNAAGWAEPIRRGLGVHADLQAAELTQPLGNVVRFEIGLGRESLTAILDYDDSMELNASVDASDLYFKLQYRRGGYGSAHVVPGGYVSKQPALYRYAKRWRELRERSSPRHDVLGRFGLHWAREIRSRALMLLGEQDRFDFEGGTRALWWGEYMDELVTARVCLDLPGNGELCYRLVEYLAVGACIIGPELEAELPVPLVSSVELVRVPRDLAGLVDGCERLLADEALRARLGHAAAEYFDRHLALEQLGAYYLHCAGRTLGAL
jgi:hypothetical protein